jgi:hypothetical protein
MRGTRIPAIPTIKNYALDSLNESERRGQFHRSAMAEPRPGSTAFMITVIIRLLRVNSPWGLHEYT